MAIRFKWIGILLPTVLGMGIISSPATTTNTERPGKLHRGLLQWLTQAWLSPPPISRFWGWQCVYWDILTPQTKPPAVTTFHDCSAPIA